jgi:hypothetical protein
MSTSSGSVCFVGVAETYYFTDAVQRRSFVRTFAAEGGARPTAEGQGWTMRNPSRSKTICRRLNRIARDRSTTEELENSNGGPIAEHWQPVSGFAPDPTDVSRFVNRNPLCRTTGVGSRDCVHPSNRH